jgi:hypothetical protein
MSKFPGDTCAFAATAAYVPLHHNPGEKWSYGINMDILGCVVEVVSGTSKLDSVFLLPTLCLSVKILVLRNLLNR